MSLAERRRVLEAISKEPIESDVRGPDEGEFGIRQRKDPDQKESEESEPTGVEPQVKKQTRHQNREAFGPKQAAHLAGYAVYFTTSGENSSFRMP